MLTTKASVQAQFGQTAENYRHSRVHATGNDLKWLAKEVEQGKYEQVLDVGCGAGHTSVAVAPYAKQVIALDITGNMLEQVKILAAERNVPNVETQLGDAEALPFTDATFDLVVSRISAHHWPNPVKALSETARVLKPAGRFILIDVIGFETYAEDTFLQTIELIRDLSHVRDHSVSQWSDYFKQTGFSVPAVAQWELPLDFEDWVKRMLVPEHRVAILRDLFESISENVRTAMRYHGDTFSLQVASFDAYKL